MGKHFWTIINLLIIGAFIGGAFATCGQQGANYYYDSEGNYVEITNPQEQCVLYRVVKGNAKVYAAGLFVANYAAMKQGFYTKQEALEALADIEAAVVDSTATVGSVINTLSMVAAKAAKVGAPELILITEGLSVHAGDNTPLDDCTRYKLLAEIGKNRTLINAF